MFRSMRLMMDAVGKAIRSGQGQQGHQGRHRHGGMQQATAEHPGRSAAAQDFYVVFPNVP
jgi:hypothetical protein